MANYASKVLEIQKEEVGYLEKKNGDIRYLYDKTANAGSANYTKYGKEMHDIYPSIMDYPAPWCDSHVDWCFQKAYGISNAKGLIGGDFNDYTVASAQLYKNKGAYHTSNPKVGDQIFFNNGTKNKICHTGLVYKVDSKKVYTREGNTSNAAGVVANGGCVAEKSYLLTYKKIDGYGRPKYDEEVNNGLIYNGLDYSYVFNTEYYKKYQPDVVNALGSSQSALFGHFINNGMKEGRKACSTFDVNVYRNNYKDLRDAFDKNGVVDFSKYFQHYITNGRNEKERAIVV